MWDKYHQFLARTVEDDQGCLIWKYSKVGGYGIAYLKPKMVLVHRYIAAYKAGLTLDDIKDKVVRHTCDVPSCINPEHLIIGTQSVNMQDSFNKDRSNHQGENNPRATFTEDEVRAIREEYATTNITQRQLARNYRSPKSTIRNILTRYTWAHVN